MSARPRPTRAQWSVTEEHVAHRITANDPAETEEQPATTRSLR
jgi:hypothetical protein